MLAAMAFGAASLIAAETPAPGGSNPNHPAALLFEQHCQKCHSGPKHKGDFDIGSLSPDFSQRTHVAQWLTVLDGRSRSMRTSVSGR